MSSSPRDPTNPPGRSPEDAESAFNTWLDATFAAQAAVPEQARSPEAIAARALQALAAEEDASLAHAATAAPWKDVLMSSQPITTTPPTTTGGDVRVTPSPRNRSRFGRMLNSTVSIAAVLAIFIAGFATAWVARDRFGSDHKPPVLQIAASPSTQVTCTTRTLSKEEVDRIVADYKKQPKVTLADFTLSDKPVSEADAEAAIATWHASYSCPDGQLGTNSLLWEFSTSTTDAVAGKNLSADPAWVADHLTNYRALLEPVSRILVPQPPAAYIVDSNDPTIAPYIVNIGPMFGTVAMVPNRFVSLADGRIGAPILFAMSGGASASTKGLSGIRVSFVIFKRIDGQWLMDDGMALCPGDCTVAEAALDVQIAKNRRLATVIGSPVATPETSPAASPKP